MNNIELSKNNIKNINYNDIIAITIAECGAMGEPGGFYAVDNKLNKYHYNFSFGGIDYKDLTETFPLLETFTCSIGEVTNLDSGWKCFDMGFGNYLIIREKYYNDYSSQIKEKLNKDYQLGELYNSWYDLLKNII